MITEYINRNGHIRWQISDFPSAGNINVSTFPADTCQNSQVKRLTLKSLVPRH